MELLRVGPDLATEQKQFIYMDLYIHTEVGNGNPLQYSCLENPTARGAWRATVRGVTERDVTGVT